jgi:hypothetical protein
MTALSTLPPMTLDAAPVLDATPDSLRGMIAAGGLARFEAVADYAGLLTALVEAIAPRDSIEWLWTKDVADLSWEARRLRVAKAAVLTLSRLAAAAEVARTALESPVDAEIDGQAYRRRLEELERLDRLVIVAGVRRDAVLRELEQRRDRIDGKRRAAIQGQRG